MSEARFSRSGVTSLLGKLTEQIPAIKVSGDTKELLESEARKAGMTLQEFCRDLLTIRAHGLDTMKRLHAMRLEVVSGKIKE